MKRRKIPAYVHNFCKGISSDKPVFVTVYPVPGALPLHCFPIVSEHVETYGGKPRFGWCIHIWKRVLIEAEFHCVWEDFVGNLADVTPRLDGGSKILFLPDPHMEYQGTRVENIIKPLSMDPDVFRFIELAHMRFGYLEYGNLIDKSGEFTNNEAGYGRLKDEMLRVDARIKVKFGNDRRLIP